MARNIKKHKADAVQKQGQSMLRQLLQDRRARRVTALLGCVVLAVTVWRLSRPAITAEAEAFCGMTEHVHSDACFSVTEHCFMEEHQHSDECYIEGYVCGFEEEHEHTDDCFEMVEVLTCAQKEHAHTDACYSETRTLACEEEEHTHGEDCYDDEGNLICDEEEHTHTDDCYETERELVCEEEEHAHGEGCFEEIEQCTCGLEAHVHIDTCIGPVLDCGMTNHVHTAECFEKTAVCGFTEHIHGLACYSDPSADTDDTYWLSRLPEKADSWRVDLLRAAESQKGYLESKKNYEVQPDGMSMKGYTIYGAHFGVPYGDWCAAYLSWCIEASGVDMPTEVSCARWIRAFERAGLYRPGREYLPSPGDVVFFDWEGDGKSDHVGLVLEASFDDESGLTALRTIEGNSANSVREVSYSGEKLASVFGYGLMPERDEATGLAVNHGAWEEPAEEESKSGGSGSGQEKEPPAPALVTAPVLFFEGGAAGIHVYVEADAGTFDSEVTMMVRKIRAERILDAVSGAVADETDSEIESVEAVDITFYDDNDDEVEPKKPVRVYLRSEKLVSTVSPLVVHVDNRGEAAVVAQTAPEVLPEAPKDNEVVFEVDSFSVYAIVYTVDFMYAVDGETYTGSIPGGGALTLRELAGLLGLPFAGKPAVMEQFFADVQKIEFSDPSLLWVGKTESETTLGALKAANGLTSEFSADLTPEEIARINGTVIPAGEWVLLSLKPFLTTETLTVTMKNGEVFTVQVTDAQLVPNSNAGTIDVNKSYLIMLKEGETYYILKNDGSVDATHTPENSGNFENLSSDYCWTFDYIFTEKDLEHSLNYNYYIIRPIDNKSRSIALNAEGEALVQQGNNNVSVVPVEGVEGAYRLLGYNNVRLNFEGGAFSAKQSTEENPFEGVAVYIYEMESLPTYDYRVRSADEERGSVSVVGGSYQTDTETGTHYYQATSDHNKRNAGTITATIVDHRDVNGVQKWVFDHWEQDGVPLDRNQYGETIAAETLPIPFNGSNLIAYFRQNPAYVVPPKEKQPSSIEDMSRWMEELQNRSIPLDKDATDKTAEVYDYQNRIYRVDITSKANFQTFAGNLDMAFCLDVSNSMKFPSALEEATTYYNDGANPIPIYQINNFKNDGYWWERYDNRTWLDTGRGWDNPYYLIADSSGTATVFRVYYQDGNWKAQDASRETEDDKSFVIGADFKTNWTAAQYDDQNNPNKNHPFNAGDNDNSIYTIYDAGNDGNNRFYYLNQSFGGGSEDLNKISELLRVAGDASPNVKIAYNTFNKELGTQRSDFAPTSSSSLREIDFAYSAGGGTRPDQAFNDAQRFSWTADYTLDAAGTLTETDRYVILVTDGAPQGVRTQKGADGKDVVIGPANNEEIIEEVRAQADNLKNNSHVKLITIGLSMENVISGKNLLYDLADLDQNGNKMFYLAESASDLPNVFRQITKTLMENVIVYGDITDTVGEAFYPVDKATGLPLKPGDMIDIEGIRTTDESEAAGVVQPDGRTIKWLNQPIDSAAGWHGTVYVKAQEDLLGGNAVNTNAGSATVTATQYKTGGKDPVSFVDSGLLSTLTLTESLPTPKVNVNELTFPKTGTEWTVYLGTNVDPASQLRALYEDIQVEQVINTDGSLHFLLAPNSTSDNRYEDGTNEVTGIAATFPLAPVILQHMIDEGGTDCAPYLTTDGSGNTVLNWETFLPAILAEGGVEVPYHPYGIEGIDSNIVITLEKNETAPDNIGQHTTETVGTGVETYTLTVKYNPDYDHVLPPGQGGKTSGVEMHTGTFGTMYQGHAAGRETSTNTHTINVYAVPLDVYKTDGSGNALPGAVFKLYKEDASGAAVAGLESGKTYVEVASGTSGSDGIARLASGGADFGLVRGETYYLIEDTAPEGYTKLSTVWAVKVQTEIGQFTELDGSPIEITHAEDVVTGISADMYPFNWDMGARVVLNGITPIEIIVRGAEEGTTDVAPVGAFVSNEQALSFRHTVVNALGGELSLTANKSWDDNDDPKRPASVTVTLWRVSEKDHAWGAARYVPSTCTAEGVMEYTCTACGEKDTYAISPTGHTPGARHRENEIAATCTSAGGYDTVVRCQTCDAVLSTEHTDIAALGHDWGEWTVTTPAQPGVAGVETRECSHDDTHIQTREIAALPLTYNVTVYFRYTGNGSGGTDYPGQIQTITSCSGSGIGDMTIEWDWNQWTEDQPFDVDGLVGGSTYSTYSTANVNGSTYSRRWENNRWVERGKRQTLTISGITQDLTLYVTIRNGGWAGTSNNLIYQPTFAGLRSSARTLNSAAPGLFSESIEVVARRLNEKAPGTGMTQAELTAYLAGIGDKNAATCSEAEGSVHTYKEEVGTYNLGAPGWSLNREDLPTYNEYGKPYRYYFVEEPVTGYVTTYSGQTGGMKDGSTDLTITNTQQKTSVRVTKTWNLAEPSRVIADGTGWPAGVEVQVTLYKSIGGADPTPTGRSATLTAAQQSYVFTDLPEYAGEELISYSVVETGVTGLAEPDAFTATVSGDAASGYTITNTEQPRTKDFAFTKLWRDALGHNLLPWPAGEEITVAIRKDSDTYATYTIRDSDLTVDTEITAAGDTSGELPKLTVTAADAATGYAFSLSGLPYGPAPDGFTYTVSEGTVTGYQPAKYFNGDTQVMGATYIGDGGTIANDQIGAVLPSTGGRGTNPFALLGGSAMLLALGAHFALKKRRRA